MQLLMIISAHTILGKPKTPLVKEGIAIVLTSFKSACVKLIAISIWDKIKSFIRVYDTS